MTFRNKFTQNNQQWCLPRRHRLRHWRDLMSFLLFTFLFLLLFLIFLLTITCPEENSKIFIITQKNTTNITKLKAQPSETRVLVLTNVCVSRLICLWRQCFWENVCHFLNITSSCHIIYIFHTHFTFVTIKFNTWSSQLVNPLHTCTSYSESSQTQRSLSSLFNFIPHWTSSIVITPSVHIKRVFTDVHIV